jgi:hypothetical protein
VLHPVLLNVIILNVVVPRVVAPTTELVSKALESQMGRGGGMAPDFPWGLSPFKCVAVQVPLLDFDYV